MINENSCEKHDRLPVEGFLRSVNLRRVNRSLKEPRKGCRPMEPWSRVNSLLASELDMIGPEPRYSPALFSVPNIETSRLSISDSAWLGRPTRLALRKATTLVVVWRPDGCFHFFIRKDPQKWTSTRPSGRTFRSGSRHPPLRSTFLVCAYSFECVGFSVTSLQAFRVSVLAFIISWASVF
uniref:Uncharacterized protein n=1 Tax=Salix viminalis TaxID=40686 RepID=A0A6N2L3B6_SALVM